MEVPDDAEAQQEEGDSGDAVSEWKGGYLRISAWTAGECLKPTLLP